MPVIPGRTIRLTVSPGCLTSRLRRTACRDIKLHRAKAYTVQAMQARSQADLVIRPIRRRECPDILLPASRGKGIKAKCPPAPRMRKPPGLTRRE